MSLTITPAEFQQHLTADPSLVLIDVRTPPEFDAIHVPQARNIPLNELKPHALAATGAIGKGQTVYLVCNSGIRSELAAGVFTGAGFSTVEIAGGTQAWERAGLPVARSESGGVSLNRQVRIAAGAIVLAGIVLGWFVHRWFFGLSAFVAAGLVVAGLSDWCGMGLLLTKAPWNQRKIA